MEITIEEIVDGIIALLSIFVFVSFTIMILNMSAITAFLERLV